MFSHCRARTGSAEFIALIANEALECLVQQGATIMPASSPSVLNSGQREPISI